MAEVIIPPFALPSADTRHSFLNTQFTALSKMSDEVDADDDDLDHDGGSCSEDIAGLSRDVDAPSLLSRSGLNEVGNSRDSLPQASTAQSPTTVSTLSIGSVNGNDVRRSRDPRDDMVVDGSLDSAEVTVSFRVRPAVLDSKSSKKSHLWKYFAHFDVLFHPDKRFHRICLICRGKGVDKCISVGRSASTGPLLGHLRTHNAEYTEFLKAKDEAEASVASAAKSAEASKQPSIVSFVPNVNSTRQLFKRKFAKWVARSDMPLSVGESEDFLEMMSVANRNLVVPDHKVITDILSTKKVNASEKLRSLLSNRFYSITSDHWTSAATENFGALTLHVIHDFKLKSFVMSCVHHENGTSALEVEAQLVYDLGLWRLEKCHLFCCVTDTASNMNAFGISVSSWPNCPFVRHHYCADHVLQLTAVKAFSGDIHEIVPHVYGDTDNTIVAVRKARVLVNHFHSSCRANQKLCQAQKTLDPSCTPLKLLSDVKTRWWSTHTLLERILHLKQALKVVFDNEFRAREEINTPTPIELMRLTDDDFEAISNVLFVLTPFKQAQKALEGEKYVNLSLLPLAINNLRTSLLSCQASADPDLEQNLLQLIDKMRIDFTSRWGDRCQYSRTVVRGQRNRQIGVPTYAFWATALDPRTKKKLSKILPEDEIRELWRDVEAAIMSLAERFRRENDPEDNQDNQAAPPRTLDAVNRLLKSNNNFFADSDDEDDDVSYGGPVSLADTVAAEVRNYRAEKGQPMYVLGDDSSSYSDPLVWWKANASKFPHVWLLASVVLAVPATSAPSERVFSAAANIVDKKRVRLKPENVDLLVFLKTNREIVDWD